MVVEQETGARPINAYLVGKKQRTGLLSHTDQIDRVRLDVEPPTAGSCPCDLVLGEQLPAFWV
jgi:hypothetical protein